MTSKQRPQESEECLLVTMGDLDLVGGKRAQICEVQSQWWLVRSSDVHATFSMHVQSRSEGLGRAFWPKGERAASRMGTEQITERAHKWSATDTHGLDVGPGRGERGGVSGTSTDASESPSLPSGFGLCFLSWCSYQSIPSHTLQSFLQYDWVSSQRKGMAFEKERTLAMDDLLAPKDRIVSATVPLSWSAATTKSLLTLVMSRVGYRACLSHQYICLLRFGDGTHTMGSCGGIYTIEVESTFWGAVTNSVVDGCQ